MARGSSGIKMPTEFEEVLNQSFFKRLFVSERKQIAMIADEKSLAQISHRIFATRSLRNVGNGMNEKSLEVLKQYDFEVNRVLRGRGGMILNTDRGVKLFLECVKSDKYYERENDITRRVADSGFLWVDTYVQNTSGEILTPDEDGRRFYVKDWYEGKECDTKSQEDILKSVRTLARLHILMKMEPVEEYRERSLREEYLRHNQELRKIRKFIRNKGASNVFEKNYLASVEQFLERAQYAVKLLDETDYDDLRERAWREGQVCHGEYNQHNILMLKNDHFGTAVTNFGHWSFDIQIADLYRFMRKILEKYNWNLELAGEMLREYHKIRPISAEEWKNLRVRFTYPEKYWKLANYYYSHKKVWISEKNVEKLQNLIRQREIWENFAEECFRDYPQ